MQDLYGKPVKDVSSVVVVSAKAAAIMLSRAEGMKCTCLTCNPIPEIDYAELEHAVLRNSNIAGMSDAGRRWPDEWPANGRRKPSSGERTE